MKLGLFFIILCFSIGIISYMTYNINEYMGNSLELREINSSNKKCHTINIPTTLNHLIPLNNNYLISSEYKSLEFYNFNNYLDSQINKENIYLINIKNEKYSQAKIIDFPKNIPFHPGGLSLYEKSENNYILYIINHSIDYIHEGQERIEKINISYNPKTEEVTMIYDSSIILPNEYFLKVDSITVINESLFYFTTNKPFPSPRNSEEFYDIKTKILYFGYECLKTIMTMLNIKKCNAYIYNKKNVGKEITIIDNSESLLNKGIAFDKKRNLLYIIKSMEKELNIYKINNQDNEIKPKLIKKIPILYVGNNIYYDKNKDLIYIGINGKMNEYDSILNSYKKNKNIIDVSTFSGYEIIDPQNNYSINELMLMKNEYKWISSSIKINHKNYMSSIFTNGIFVCEN